MCNPDTGYPTVPFNEKQEDRPALGGCVAEDRNHPSPTRWNVRSVVTPLALLLVVTTLTRSQWVSIPTQFSTNEINPDISRGIFITEKIGWVALSRYIDSSTMTWANDIFKTTDGGYHWIQQYRAGNTPAYVNLFASDSIHCWALAAGTMYMTSDGGVTWDSSFIANPILGYPFKPLFFFPNGFGFTANLYPWLTSDNGVTWSIGDTTNLLTCARDVDFTSPRLGWLVTRCGRFSDGGFIARTFDGGWTWPADSFWYASPMEAVDMIDSLSGYVISNSPFVGGHIFKTSDGGITWNIVLPPPEFYYTDITFLNHASGWVIGQYGTVKSTIDSGMSWTPETSGVTTDLGTICIVEADSIAFIFGDSGTLLRHDLITSLQAENEMPESPSLFQNYPNPFNGSTTIEFSVPAMDHINLSIHNILGEEIDQLIDEVRGPGYYRITWPSPNNPIFQPSGVYLITLISNSERRTKSMILLK